MPRSDAITDRFVRSLCARLSEGKRVRRALPIWGRVHIDRPLPFLCVYRRPRAPDLAFEELVNSDASYLLASGDPRLHESLSRLVQTIAKTMVGHFGAFLLLELSSGDVWESPNPKEAARPRPCFRVVAPAGEGSRTLVDSFEGVLSRVKVQKRLAAVEVLRRKECSPRTMRPLIPAATAKTLGCTVMGLHVQPIFRDATGKKLFPQILRELDRGLSAARRQIFFDFICSRTMLRPPHYHALGRRAVVKAVWDVDRRLAEVSNSFDFLLQVTPVNTHEAWRRFQADRYERRPVLRYRPLPVEPVTLKRQLFTIPVERIEDPTLVQLFREKQDELDRKITMLVDIGTPRFIYGSAQTYGGVEDDLLELANQLLDRVPAHTREGPKSGYLDLASLTRLAEAEIAYYRRQYPEAKSTVRVRDDIAGGFMVSRGALLISRHARIPATRVDALLQHEVGTHLLTYHNGRAQPFRQLYSGLAGYEAFQEGLAVLAEYLAGGLNRPRVRLLAARVLAVRRLLDGASFIDVFRELNRTHGFYRRAAFSLTMRVYRGGGLTKDAVYLRGLGQVLDYLGNGGDLSPLFVGKIAAAHVPLISELQWRKVLTAAPLRPRYLDLPDNQKRLEHVRSGLSVLQLCEE